jgi:cold shock CspA family protein
MAKSKESWNKKEMENLRKKKKEEKAKRKLEKKENSKDGKRSFEDMIAYVDENGQLTSQAPDASRKKQAIDPESIEISVRRKTAEEEADAALTGKVAFFNTEKGYGFIKGDDRESYFVHVHDLLEPIAENDTVTFKTEPGPRGIKAIEVKKVKPVAAVVPPPVTPPAAT